MLIIMHLCAVGTCAVAKLEPKDGRLLSVPYPPSYQVMTSGTEEAS